LTYSILMDEIHCWYLWFTLFIIIIIIIVLVWLLLLLYVQFLFTYIFVSIQLIKN
jgi:hypothetical protein